MTIFQPEVDMTRTTPDILEAPPDARAFLMRVFSLADQQGFLFHTITPEPKQPHPGPPPHPSVRAEPDRIVVGWVSYHEEWRFSFWPENPERLIPGLMKIVADKITEWYPPYLDV